MFANAALDFVSCLIHHARGSEERRQMEELMTEEEEATATFNGSVIKMKKKGEMLTEAALNMLQRCSQIMAKMHNMTNCPTFQVSSIVLCYAYRCLTNML